MSDRRFRVGVGGMIQESHSFSPASSSLERFRSGLYLRGREVFDTLGSCRHEVAGGPERVARGGRAAVLRLRGLLRTAAGRSHLLPSTGRAARRHSRRRPPRRIAAGHARSDGHRGGRRRHRPPVCRDPRVGRPGPADRGHDRLPRQRHAAHGRPHRRDGLLPHAAARRSRRDRRPRRAHPHGNPARRPPAGEGVPLPADGAAGRERQHDRRGVRAGDARGRGRRGAARRPLRRCVRGAALDGSGRVRLHGDRLRRRAAARGPRGGPAGRHLLGRPARLHPGR